MKRMPWEIHKEKTPKCDNESGKLIIHEIPLNPTTDFLAWYLCGSPASHGGRPMPLWDLQCTANFTHDDRWIRKKAARKEKHNVSGRKKFSGASGGYSGSTLLRETLEILKELVKLPSSSILKDQEDAGLIVKPSIEAKNVRVVQAALNLDLPSQVVVVLVLIKLLLKNDLQGYHIPTLFINNRGIKVRNNNLKK